RYHLALDVHVADEGGGGVGAKAAAASASGGMKEAFASYLAKHTEVEAIFVGTRRTDPHGGRLSKDGFDVTDGGWPRFMRVHPVIEWHYAEVWAVCLFSFFSCFREAVSVGRGG
ncbi:MAG: hypothetical protein LQ346_008953, partial [Caloplaca aetnensis]